MEASVQTHPSHPRLRLAGGILKALFTTSPTKPTKVILGEDGSVEIAPGSESNATAKS